MANLINSIKAFGEKVTGEKIEGTTLIDSMKDMGKKMTGKEIEGNSLLAIIDETTEGYEGGGSKLEPITIQEDTYNITIDGIKLLNLLKSHNVDVDSELDYGFTTYAGVVLGLTYGDSSDGIDNGSNISLGRNIDGDDNNFAVLKISNFTDDNTIQLTTTPVTFTSLLTDIGSNAVFQNIYISSGLTILPMLAVRTGSSYNSTSYQLSNDEFNELVKFEPVNE